MKMALMAPAQPGDLVLVRTKGVSFAIARRLVRSNYDHIAVVMHDDETLNIVRPRTVMLRLSTIGKPQNAPLVLRPNWHSPKQREEFMAEMQRFVGTTYDARKALLGVFVTFLRTWLGLKLCLSRRDASTDKHICTEAILFSLIKTLPDFSAIEGTELDYYALGFATTNDFLRIAERFPNLLAVVS